MSSYAVLHLSRRLPPPVVVSQQIGSETSFLEKDETRALLHEALPEGRFRSGSPFGPRSAKECVTKIVNCLLLSSKETGGR
jgi:hypothetical protein